MDKKVVLLTIAVFVNFIFLFGQDIKMTPYETARVKLADETINKMVNIMSAGDKVDFLYALSTLEDKNTDPYKCLTIKESLIALYCGMGNLFKTDADIMTKSLYFDKRYEGYFLKGLNTIGAEYNEKRGQLEKMKGDEDFKKEQERQFYETGYGHLLYSISSELKQWAAKGEYETSDSYEKRLKKSLINKLDEICFNQCCNTLKNYINIEKGSYDADNRTQTIRLFIKENNIILADVKGMINMPINDAKNFSLNRIYWNNCKWSYAENLYVVDNYILPSELKIAYNNSPDSHATGSVYDIGSNLENFIYYTVHIKDSPDFCIDGNQLIGLPENVKNLLSGYCFNYVEFLSDLVPQCEILAQISQIQSKYKKAFNRIKFDNKCSSFSNDFYTQVDAADIIERYHKDCINNVRKIVDYNLSFSEVKNAIENDDYDNVEKIITDECISYVLKANQKDATDLFKRLINNYTLPANWEQIAKRYIENNSELMQNFSSFDRKVRKNKKNTEKQLALYDKAPYFIFYYHWAKQFATREELCKVENFGCYEWKNISAVPSLSDIFYDMKVVHEITSIRY